MSNEEKPKFVPDRHKIYSSETLTQEEKEYFDNLPVIEDDLNFIGLTRLVETPITFTGECSVFKEDGTEVKLSSGEDE